MRDAVADELTRRAEQQGLSEALVRSNEVRAGGVSNIRPIWWARAHNAGTLAVLGAWACSWGWIAQVATRRRALLLSRGLCAKCRYDIASITPDGTGARTCPECGSNWRATRNPLPHGRGS